MVFEELNRAQIAAAFGVTTRSINQWVNEGMPRNDNGTYSLPDCISWALDRAIKKAPAPDPQEAQDWMTEFRKERAIRARLEREELEGQLFRRSDVTEAWINRYSHFKRNLLAWSKRLPGRVHGLGEREMIQAIEDEATHLLSLLARPGRFTELDGEEL